MKDNELNVLLRQVFAPLMAADPDLSTLAGLDFVQNFQPRQLGMSSTAKVYFVKLFDKRYGFTGFKDVYQATGLPAPNPTGIMQHQETQMVETHYQIMALVPQTPSDTLGLTESDVVNSVAAIIASDAARLALQAAGVQILRITDVKNPYFTDERDRWEASPSFDVAFTHSRVRVVIDQVATEYDAAVNRI